MSNGPEQITRRSPQVNMDLAIKCIVLALAAYLIWNLFQGRCLFEVQICDCVARVRRGKVPANLLHQISAFCHEKGIQRGTIRGIPDRSGIRLVFSRTIPHGSQQALRNVWRLH